MGLPQALPFVSGETIHALSCINITIVDDDIVENTENFTVKLLVDFPRVSVSRGLSTSVVEIIDNDKGIYYMINAQCHVNATCF